MIKVSKLTDYAVVILSCLVQARGQRLSATTISEQTSLPSPTVAKVLKLLSKSDLVHSERGSQGGYKLALNESDISIGDVILAIDGPIALAACVESSDDCCSIESTCPVKGRWDDVNTAIRRALEGVSLKDMMQPVPDFIKKQTHKESAHEQHI